MSNVSGVHRASTIENKYSNTIFYKNTRSTVLKFQMDHDLTSGSQDCKIGSGRISKIVVVTINSKNKISETIESNQALCEI